MIEFHSKRLCLGTLFGVLLLSGCGDSSQRPPQEKNVLPVVDIAGSREAVAGSVITMTATAEDSDGTIEKVQWKQLSGPNVVFDAPDILNTDITLPNITAATAVQLRLTVTDNTGGESSVTITLHLTVAGVVGNQAPMANAGDDIRVVENQDFTLSASASTDSDGDTLEYEWLDHTSGQVVSRLDSYTASLSVAGDYSFTVKVTDTEGAFDEDTLKVSVTPELVSDFSAALKLELVSEKTHADQRDCEQYQAVQTDYTSAVIQHSVLGDIQVQREQDKVDIAAEKKTINDAVAQQDAVLVVEQKALMDLQDQIPFLEQEIEDLTAVYRECVEQKSVNECTAERALRDDLRDTKREEERTISDKESDIRVVEAEIVRLRSSLDYQNEREESNQKYFTQLDAARHNEIESIAELLPFHAKPALTLGLHLRGELKESANEYAVHARLLVANDNALQALGIINFSQASGVFPGGVGEYNWGDVWPDIGALPTQASKASKAITALFTSSDTSTIDIDYATYCTAGFTDNNSNYSLGNVYLEVLRTKHVAYINEYRVTFDALKTFDQLSALATDYGLLSQPVLLSMLNEPLAGVDVEVISEIDSSETAGVAAIMEASHLQTLLAAFAIPVVKSDLPTGCTLDAQDWCQYRGWWLRHDGSPVNPNGAVDTAGALMTLTFGEIHTIERELIPVTTASGDVTQ